MNSIAALDVYSTFARDILIEESTKLRREQPGGPALFIQDVLQHQNVSFAIHAGPVVDVEILITESGEFGSVQPTFPPESFPACGSGKALISTLFQEWNPQVLASACEELFIDVQGFVRVPGSFGKKQMWAAFQGEWIKKVSVLKVTEEELQYVPADGIEDQKNRILLVTKGKAGVTAFVQGEQMEFVPPRLVTSKNTIGAGDTFFATVVGSLVQGLSMDRSIRSGMESAASLLEKIV